MGLFNDAFTNASCRQAFCAPHLHIKSERAIHEVRESHLARSSCCWTTTLQMLTTPCKFSHTPLLDQAMVAIVIARIAIVRQRGGYHRRRRRWWCFASLVGCPTAVRLFACWPSSSPVGETCIAIVRARCRADGHRWRRWCNWHHWCHGHGRRWRPEHWHGWWRC